MKNLYSVIVIVILVSCASKEKRDASFIINGQLKYATGMKIFLQELDLQDVKSLDSAFVDPQGKFSFKYKPADQGFYLLKLPDGRFISLLLNKGEHVAIAADLMTFPRTYIITGSTGSALLKTFYDFTAKNKRKGDSLTEILRTHQYASDYYQLSVSFDTLFMNIWEEQKKFEKNFIDKNIKSLSALLILNYAFGPRPVLTEEEDFSYYVKVDSSLMRSFPMNKHVIYHHKRIAEYLRQKEAKTFGTDKLQRK